jgi:hypothetical protein
MTVPRPPGSRAHDHRYRALVLYDQRANWWADVAFTERCPFSQLAHGGQVTFRDRDVAGSLEDENTDSKCA